MYLRHDQFLTEVCQTELMTDLSDVRLHPRMRSGLQRKRTGLAEQTTAELETLGWSMDLPRRVSRCSQCRLRIMSAVFVIVRGKFGFGAGHTTVL
jgi:hypothetical protein